jgi:Protein of unknown function (DUF2786)
MQDQISDTVKCAKIIERVRALLAMTTKNGCTEAEAMTAAVKAAELMEQYDLELGDVRSLEDERIAQQSKPFAADGRPREMHAAGIYVSLVWRQVIASISATRKSKIGDRTGHGIGKRHAQSLRNRISTPVSQDGNRYSTFGYVRLGLR